MFISWWVDKQNVVHPKTRLLFSNKKQQNVDRSYNMDKTQEHYAKWEKPDIREYILYDSVDMTLLEKTKNKKTPKLDREGWEWEVADDKSNKLLTRTAEF